MSHASMLVYIVMPKKTVCNHKRSNKGRTKMNRPKKLSARDQRHVLRSLIVLREKDKSFLSKRIRIEGGVNNSSDRTVRRYLSHEGYYYLQSRNKDKMSNSDMKRVVFAKMMLKEYQEGFGKMGLLSIWRAQVLCTTKIQLIRHRLQREGSGESEMKV